MFLHIGQHEIVPLEGIIAILGVKHGTRDNNKWWRSALLRNQKKVNGKVKSVIVMDTGEVYFSHIGAQTLKKRIQKTQRPEPMRRLAIKNLKIAKEKTI
ncbi:MAG: extracellular matrix/biofilm biosynthesis regulator RemA family protein [bacterium]